MLIRILIRVIILFSLYVAGVIGEKLWEKTGVFGTLFIPYGVVILAVIIIPPLMKNSSSLKLEWGEKKSKWRESKAKRFKDKARKSGLSAGEYMMTILPKENISFIESHADDLPQLENYINQLAHSKIISSDQAHTLMQHFRFLHSDRSEGAYVFSLLSEYDTRCLTSWKDRPELQSSYILELTEKRTITAEQAKALREYCRKLAGQQ